MVQIIIDRENLLKTKGTIDLNVMDLKFNLTSEIFEDITMYIIENIYKNYKNELKKDVEK